MIFKRLFDIIISTMALLALCPLLLLIGVLVRIHSTGPAIFRQTRIGRNGRPFTLLKFRSMSIQKQTAPAFTPGATPRITRLGKWIRKTKTDELPQLWNVLVGDMSLVGPRPEVPEWTKVYPERWEVVLSVRPGITDPASIIFRDEEALLATAPDPTECYRNEILPKKLDLAARYATNRTLLGDISIILRTALVIVRPANRGSSSDECGP
jgi:lipopolysaccharide/colanic/teichoic acid biosynthesis glycosyltransferase